MSSDEEEFERRKELASSSDDDEQPQKKRDPSVYYKDPVVNPLSKIASTPTKSQDGTAKINANMGELLVVVLSTCTGSAIDLTI